MVRLAGTEADAVVVVVVGAVVVDVVVVVRRVVVVVVLGGAVVVAATVGDLFESLVKRDLEVKDTSGLLLGHGGMLDRIDSLLFAGPAAYFCLLAFGHV